VPDAVFDDVDFFVALVANCKIRTRITRSAGFSTTFTRSPVIKSPVAKTNNLVLWIVNRFALYPHELMSAVLGEITPLRSQVSLIEKPQGRHCLLFLQQSYLIALLLNSATFFRNAFENLIIERLFGPSNVLLRGRAAQAYGGLTRVAVVDSAFEDAKLC
jgi:hypothetical protein